MKKFLSAILIFTTSLMFMGPIPMVRAASTGAVTAAAAILIDGQTGRVLYSKSPTVKRAPASTTKVLTAMTVLDEVSLDKVVSIPKSVEEIEPSKVYLKGGENYTIRNLLKALLMKSANDAAEALAIRVGGSRAKFSKLMNKKAKSVGAKSSNFIMPNGLPADGQYSTAYDLARIMKAAEKYPFIVETLNLKSTVIRSQAGRKITLKSNNKMLWQKTDVIGKTGWTRRAKYCFVGKVSQSYKGVIMAMLGSKNLWSDVKKLAEMPFTKMFKALRSNKKLWARREEVEKVQKALNNAGFSPGKIDGKFGFKTLSAAEKFQKSKGLSPDGIVGPKTWKILQKYL